MHPNAIARHIVDAAYHLHTTLGPGLLEHVYETILAAELEKRSLTVIRQYPIPLAFNGLQFQACYRADLLVGDLVLVELKSIEAIAPVHKKQLLTYLRIAQKPLGLLINFNVELIKHGITRIANNL